MDTRTGRIYSEEEARRKVPEQFRRRMEVQPTEKQLARKPPKVGRNEPCPCDSGLKFKRCCLFKTPARKIAEAVRQ